MKKQIFLYFVGWISLWQFHTQNLVLEGKVLDAQTQEPVEGAYILNTKQKVLGQTNENGLFRVTCEKGKAVFIYKENYETQKVIAKKSPVTVFLKRKMEQLGEILIKSDPLRDIVHSRVVIDEAKQAVPLRSVSDLFLDIPGFSVQKRSATAMEPSLRAFKYEEMNVKYDGGNKVVNACPNRMDPMTAHIIPETVEKIEVIKGPYTVRFGQTFGGIVNMLSGDDKMFREGFHGHLYAGYETNGNNKVFSGLLHYGTEKFFVAADGEYRDFGDYKDGSGREIPSSFKVTSYSFKTGVRPGKDQILKLGWHQKFGRDIKHAGLPMDSPKDDSYIANLDYKKSNISQKIRYMQFKASYSYVDHLMTNGYLLEEPRPNYAMMQMQSPVWSKVVHGKWEIALSPAKDWMIYLGTDADLIHRDGKKIMDKTMPAMHMEKSIWQNSRIDDYGLFAEGKYKASPNSYVSLGLRADYVYANALDPDPGFANIYNNNLSKTDIVWGGFFSWMYKKPSWNLQLALGRGTRTASMTERYINRFTVGRDGKEYIGNPQLKPEINHQAELGMQKKWNGLSIGGSLYYSYFKDYITAVLEPSLATGNPPKVPKVFTNVNATQYGFDAFLSYRFAKYWTVKGDVALTKTRNITLNEPLPQVAPPTGHLELKYQRNKYWIDIRSLMVATQKDFSPSFGETQTPGYSVIDLRAGWKPTENLSLGAAVTNLTNRTYHTHLSFKMINQDPTLNGQYITEPGRSFNFFLKYRF